jgi:hypothetical protein
MYSELKGTWSSIEKDVDYKSVVWKMDKNGIPVFIFFDENYNVL